MQRSAASVASISLRTCIRVAIRCTASQLRSVLVVDFCHDVAPEACAVLDLTSASAHFFGKVGDPLEPIFYLVEERVSPKPPRRVTRGDSVRVHAV